MPKSLRSILSYFAINKGRRGESLRWVKPGAAFTLMFFSLFFSQRGFSLSCSSDSDCASYQYRHCNDFNVCEDCCPYSEDLSQCPSGCDDTGTECRNISGVACSLTIPELPKGQPWRILLLAGLAAIAISFLSLKFLRPKDKKSG